MQVRNCVVPRLPHPLGGVSLGSSDAGGTGTGNDSRMGIHMKKRTTALVVAGTGLVLLIGTSGSLALWNDAASIDAGDLSSGVLTIDTTDGAWSDDLDTWIPGDSETYTADVSIVAQGDNLTSQVTIDPASITGDPELLDALDIS